MNKHLKNFIEDANDAYPENTEAATDQVKGDIKSLSINNQMTAKSMERELIDAGIRSLIDQERARAKTAIKYAPPPSTPYTPPNQPYAVKSANPPSNAIGAQSTKRGFMDDWFIGSGSGRMSLGEATHAVLDKAITTENSIMDGHSRNVTFYQTLAGRLGETDTVKDRWQNAEIIAAKKDIWKEKDNAVA
jgi:hypothetical protein